VNSASGSRTTGANGTTAQFCYTGLLFGADTIRAVADANGNNQPDTGEPFGEATATWTVPPSTALCTVDFSTYGGWITADNGDKSNFGGNVHVGDLPLLTVTGQEQYQDKGPAVLPMDVHSITLLAVVCHTVGGGKQAEIYGTASVNGSGIYPFRIQVQDFGEPGSSDTYWILVGNGYNSGMHTLGGGNVTIH
jgi:hypothetical protein